MKGVFIIFSAKVRFALEDSLSDGGRYLFLKGKIGDRRFTYANIYSPNAKHAAFIQVVCDRLQRFQAGMLILGGDFNVPMFPALDSFTGSTAIPYKALRRIISHLHALSLHDTWLTVNPTQKDYMFYSSPHDEYSRIDYFFLTQKDLKRLQAAAIEPMTLSDHHHIPMTLALSALTKIWKYNPATLKDAVPHECIQAALTEYFEINTNQATTPLAQWEAHKCVIRGKLISLASTQKRISQKLVIDLVENMKRLEMNHKSSLA